MTKRDTTTRDRHRAYIRRLKPNCALCHEPIDYNLHHLDPMAFTVDHIVPLAKGGTDEIANKQATHRACNRTKWDAMPDEFEPRTFVTDRTW